MNQLGENDPFPFGIHENEPMQNVPVQYFHYLWREHRLEHKEFNLVADYIRRKIPEWRKTHPDYNFK
jgi:hypothetical protein